MSFQDVGKRGNSRSRQPVNATMGGGNNYSSSSSSGGGGHNGIPSSSSSSASSNSKSSPSSSSVFASMSIPAATVTTQISDSITQYHRNVGILEKIANALLTNNGGRNRNELEQQYKAQSDVLRELESRLKEQILGQRARISNKSQTSTDKQALLKLERDFERVQTTVQVTKNKVTKQMKQYQRADSARRDEELAAVAASSANCSHYNSTQNILQQQQLQLQQDRLQEEIMREREDEIRAINKGMHQVNEIYKDLAHIVGEQQDDVDQIENKMEESKTAAQSGLEQVSKANEKYGGSGANANCIIS